MEHNYVYFIFTSTKFLVIIQILILNTLLSDSKPHNSDDYDYKDYQVDDYMVNNTPDGSSVREYDSSRELSEEQNESSLSQNSITKRQMPGFGPPFAGMTLCFL